MGLHDRDYYQDHLRKLERGAPPKAKRAAPRFTAALPASPQKKPFPLWAMVLVWVGVAALLFLLFKGLRLR